MADADVALITGASSGFGLLTAVELARRGLRVFASMRDPSRADRLRAALAEARVEATVIQLDVTDPASIDRAVAEVERAAGRVDVLVNNAGYGLGGAVEDLAMDELRAQFETNFFGLVATTKAVLPGMRERRHGRIINVSSVSGRVAFPGMAAYSSSKFAVEGFSESLRHELLPFGIYVVLIEPGTFRTDIFDRNRRVAARSQDPGSPWAEVTRRMTELVDRRVERSTADPREVALAIADAVASPRPRLRQLVGSGGRATALARSVVPSRLWETAVGRVTGLAKM